MSKFVVYSSSRGQATQDIEITHPDFNHLNGNEIFEMFREGKIRAPINCTNVYGYDNDKNPIVIGTISHVDNMYIEVDCVEEI